VLTLLASEPSMCTQGTWAIVQDGTKNLGMYSSRDGSAFRDSGYDIYIAWQTLIVTGVAASAGSSAGASTFYVNGVSVGTADRVGSGMDTWRIGLGSEYPGYISAAGVLNQKLTPEEIVYLHAALSSSSFDMNAASIAACARGTYGSQTPGMGLACTACPMGYTTTGAGTAGADASACDKCAVGYYMNANSECTQCPPNRIGCGWGYDRLPAAVSILHARHANNANIVPTGSVGIPDLSGTAGMEWKLQLGSGSIPFETVDGIPCWNMNAGSLETDTRSRLGDSYTLFYHWKPRASDTPWRILHRGILGSTDGVSTCVHARANKYVICVS